MLKTSFLAVSIIITFLSCNTDAKRALNRNVHSDERFKEFFQKFQTVPAFQISRIAFPLTVIANDEADGQTKESISKDQWKYSNTLKVHNVIIAYDKISADSMKVHYAIEDTGVSVEHIFCKKQGVWKLCLIVDNSD